MITITLNNEGQAQRLWGLLRSSWRRRALQGRPLSVAVLDYDAERSKRQEIFYWSLLNTIAEQVVIDMMRYTPKTWNAQFKSMFLGVEELPGGGEKPLSWAHLKAGEFSDYTEMVAAFAADELGVLFT